MRIVSASRRTDIPAFYARWLMNRIEAGYCCALNPISRRPYRVELGPGEVDAIVFWTRNAAPMFPHLDRLDSLGYRYCFHYTLTGYPALLERHCPARDDAVRAFRALSERIGPRRVIWRYDPIVVSSVTSADWHRRNFDALLGELGGHTARIVVSLLDAGYRAAASRLRRLEGQGVRVERDSGSAATRELLRRMAEAAQSRGLTVQSCAEEPGLAECGVAPGACIDGALLREIGAVGAWRRDPGQRAACLCAASRDVGAYDTCRHGCEYCYATHDRPPADRHDPESPSLIGWHDCPVPSGVRRAR